MFSSILSLLSGAVTLFNKVADAFRDKRLRQDGKNEQIVTDLSANAEQATNAAIIEEKNAVLTHDDLVDKLRRQTGASP